jgi:predicted DNA-binding protein with PD1-like motif
MRSESEKNIVLAKLEHGEDFFAALRKVVDKHGIRSGVILNGIGMLRDFKLGYFPGKGDYDETVYKEPHELTSMSGNIATKDGDIVFHVHVNVADGKNRVYGGHLFSATVNVVNEISILKLDDIKLSRRISEKTGLAELDIG